MNKLISLTIGVSAITLVSCNNSDDRVKRDLYNSEENLIFPKGEKIENDRFHGIAWLHAVSDEEYHADDI